MRAPFNPLFAQDLKTALKKDKMPMTLPTNDLRKTKAAFVKEIVEAMNQATDGSEMLSSGDKYKKALKIWMGSATRSVLSAGKSKSFALVTTS